MDEFLRNLDSVGEKHKYLVHGYVRAHCHCAAPPLIVSTILYCYWPPAEWQKIRFSDSERGSKCYQFMEQRIKLDAHGEMNPTAFLNVPIRTVNVEQVIWTIKVNALFLGVDSFQIGFLDAKLVLDQVGTNYIYDLWKSLEKVYGLSNSGYNELAYDNTSGFLMRVTMDFASGKSWYQKDSDEPSKPEPISCSHSLPEIVMLAVRVSSTAKLDCEIVDLNIAYL